MSSSAATTPGPANNSYLYLVPTTIFVAIALVLVIIRIWTRLERTKRLYADDWLILIAEVSELRDMSCFFLC